VGGAGKRPKLGGHLATARGGPGWRLGSARHWRMVSLIAKLQSWVRAEAGAGRLLPWIPIAFGAGIAFYFAAAREPVAWVTAIAAAVICTAAFLLRRQKAFPAAVMIAALAAGFATATLKTARVAHGVLARPMFSVSLKGFVETREERERTDRFVLRVVQMDSPRRPTWPCRLSGCSEIELFEPPTRTLPPAPMPTDALPCAPA